MIGIVHPVRAIVLGQHRSVLARASGGSGKNKSRPTPC